VWGVARSWLIGALQNPTKPRDRRGGQDKPAAAHDTKAPNKIFAPLAETNRGSMGWQRNPSLGQKVLPGHERRWNAEDAQHKLQTVARNFIDSVAGVSRGLSARMIAPNEKAKRVLASHRDASPGRIIPAAEGRT